MPDHEEKMGWLTQLGVTIHEILRYGFGGFLALLVAALIFPAGTKAVLESLGTVVAVLVAIALGGAIYALHRPISEPLYWAHEGIHRLCKKGVDGFICRGAYFGRKWKIPFYLTGDAFRIVRDDKAAFNQERQQRFYLQHSELHTLYVTFWVLLVGALVVWIGDPAEPRVRGWALILLAFFSLAAGFFGNILVCTQECKVLLTVPTEDVRKLLVQTQFIAPDAQPHGESLPVPDVPPEETTPVGEADA